MPAKRAIVVTTINQATKAVRQIASACPDWDFIVVGDRKTPADWNWPGVRFLSVSEQLENGGNFAAKCPMNHYARKNVGYLWAMGNGADLLAETDDDNIPYSTFLQSVERMVKGRKVLKPGWENIYTHFTEDKIWPRGFPLELIMGSLNQRSALGETMVFDCPVQQYLADGDPDVDAIYRLTTATPTKFNANTVVLSQGTYCPFNSQNTIFWPDAYPLLYLPAYVSFRMTDIWRSFIAQVCIYALGLNIAFREATVFQERNQHSLIRDFADEVPGYLNNVRILEILTALPLSSNPAKTGANLWTCYDALVRASIVPPQEMELVELWLQSLPTGTTVPVA